jgi:hypothetical protein
MRKQAAWIIAICLAVAAGYLAWYLRHRHPIDMQKLYGSTANLQAVQSPEKVQIWKTEGFLTRQSGSPPEQSAFYRKAGEAKTVPPDLAKSLIEKLSNPSSYYDAGNSAKACIPMPGFVLGFTGEKQEVDVFLCFECDILTVQAGESFKAQGDFDPSHNELLRVIKALYPNDEKVQSLRERKRR